MKKMTTCKLGVSALIAAFCAGGVTPAWSQSSDTVATASGAPVSGATNAKAARQANRALQKKIYAAFAKHQEIDAGSISVKAKDGVVTLNGTVTDAAQIDKITGIARGVAGVTSVTTKLSVQRPFGQ
jgi:hyperosmotically inducible periplasmic protein